MKEKETTKRSGVKQRRGNLLTRIFGSGEAQATPSEAACADFIERISPRSPEK